VSDMHQYTVLLVAQIHFEATYSNTAVPTRCRTKIWSGLELWIFCNSIIFNYL